MNIELITAQFEREKAVHKLHNIKLSTDYEKSKICNQDIEHTELSIDKINKLIESLEHYADTTIHWITSPDRQTTFDKIPSNFRAFNKNLNNISPELESIKKNIRECSEEVHKENLELYNENEKKIREIIKKLDDEIEVYNLQNGVYNYYNSMKDKVLDEEKTRYIHNINNAKVRRDQALETSYSLIKKLREKNLQNNELLENGLIRKK